ncbi:hypothetical protein [Maribacter sp. 2308TA10-17]|uniref:hypothetical protein n=1 Tax=Maribacter sp. 2308TA10-17 TaxID=3386276 RepID=UPI0039BD40B0
MAKKKSKKKKKKKKKKKSFGYKSFVVVGASFHFITDLFYNRTLYSNTVFWVSAFISGIVFGIYFIQKMKLLNTQNYKKLGGFKLKAYMYSICLIMVLGGTIIFGNVLNGTILGLNFVGGSKTVSSEEYAIEKIVEDWSLSLGRSSRALRSSYPRVYFRKNGEMWSFRLKERYDDQKNYSSYQKINLMLNKGTLGYDIILDYKVIIKE